MKKSDKMRKLASLPVKKTEKKKEVKKEVKKEKKK